MAKHIVNENDAVVCRILCTKRYVRKCECLGNNWCTNWRIRFHSWRILSSAQTTQIVHLLLESGWCTLNKLVWQNCRYIDANNVWQVTFLSDTFAPFLLHCSWPHHISSACQSFRCTCYFQHIHDLNNDRVLFLS